MLAQAMSSSRTLAPDDHAHEGGGAGIGHAGGERHDRVRQRAVGLGIVAAQPIGNAFHLRPRVLHRGAIGEAADRRPDSGCAGRSIAPACRRAATTPARRAEWRSRAAPRRPLRTARRPCESVRPTMPGSAAKRRDHRSCPRTTRRWLPGVSSSALKPRPRTGAAPRSVKKSAVTWKPAICSGCSMPERLASHHSIADRWSIVRVSRRQSRKSPAVTDSRSNSPCCGSLERHHHQPVQAREAERAAGRWRP